MEYSRSISYIAVAKSIFHYMYNEHQAFYVLEGTEVGHTILQVQYLINNTCNLPKYSFNESIHFQ